MTRAQRGPGNDRTIRPAAERRGALKESVSKLAILHQDFKADVIATLNADSSAPSAPQDRRGHFVSGHRLGVCVAERRIECEATVCGVVGQRP